MNRIVVIVALMCVAAFQMKAQESVEQAMKYAEEKVKQADKNPKNGKMQLWAADALNSNELGDKKDYDRALTYANRALEIAMEQPVLKDTLKGLSCYSLGMIYLGKQNTEDAMNYFEMAMDALEQELGKDDPLTNSTKLIFSYLTMNTNPIRGFPKIQEAFYYNSIAPQDKRIENMDEAYLLLETSLEMLVALYTNFFRYALPLVEYDGKKCLVVQTADWNMEKPLVGWLAPSFTRTEEENDNFEGDDTIFCDDNFNFFVSPEEDKGKRELKIYFKHFIRNPRKLEGNEGDSRLWFLPQETYNDLLTRFREFKAKQYQSD